MRFAPFFCYFLAISRRTISCCMTQATSPKNNTVNNSPDHIFSMKTKMSA